MNTTAIAIQQPAVQESAQQQGLNGVVNIAGEEQSFGKVLKTMLQDNAEQAKSEKALVNLLKKNGEENAQELAAQLMAQNPLLLAMLMENSNVQGVSAEQLLAQLTQGTQQIQGLATADLQQTPVATAAKQAVIQPANVEGELFSTLATQATQPQIVQPQIAQPQIAQAQVVQPQVTQPQVAQEQGTNAQQAANAQAVNAQANTVQSDTALAQQATQQAEPILTQAVAQAKAPTTQTSSAKEQPQQLAEKADFETIAQKIKLEAAKTQQGTQEQGADSGNEKSQAAREQKPTDITAKPNGEQAVQANFDKQLTEIQQVKPSELTVKNQGSQEIIRQTVEGIKQNIASGKEEFVMKLTPEGLGEITVKLVSENGHTTMQLTAQNQSIQRILGAELEALKQAVRPYNVEVKEVTTANQSQLDMNMSNHSSGSQQQYQSSAASFFYNQQQGSKGQYAYQGYTSLAQGQDAGEDNSAVPQQIIHGTAINLHV